MAPPRSSACPEGSPTRITGSRRGGGSWWRGFAASCRGWGSTVATRPSARGSPRAGPGPGARPPGAGPAGQPSCAGPDARGHELGDPRRSVRSAAALRRLHDGRDAASGQVLYFCPFRTIRTYAQTAAELGAGFPARPTSSWRTRADWPANRAVPARALPQRPAAGQPDRRRRAGSG